MFRVVSNEEIAPQLHRMVIEAPRVARARKPGQFVIVRCGEGRERIPLTIADDDPEAGTITLIIQAVGDSTKEIVAIPAGGLPRATWPARWASPPRSRSWGKVVCVGGGVGTAVLFPLAKALAEAGNEVTTIIGGRSAQLRHPAGRAGRVLQAGLRHHRGRLPGREGLRDPAPERLLDDPAQQPGRRLRRGPGADDEGRRQPHPRRTA